MKPSIDAFEFRGPALGALELVSIATGYRAADRIAKETAVRLHVVRPVSPGKFLLVFSGAVEEVVSSLSAGKREVGDGNCDVLDEVFLPDPHPTLKDSLLGTRRAADRDALGVVESTTVSSLLKAADIAVKTGSVELLITRLAVGLGGKGYFVLNGEVSQVRAAVHSAAGFLESSARLAGHSVIARPHSQLWQHLQ